MFTEVSVSGETVLITSYKADTLGTPSQAGITFTIKDNAGDPMDLTGSTILCQVKKRKTSPNAILEFASGGDISEDLPNGTFTLNKTAAQMDVKAFTDYYFDIQVTDSGGAVFTYIEGLWTNSQDVSRV